MAHYLALRVLPTHSLVLKPGQEPFEIKSSGTERSPLQLIEIALSVRLWSTRGLHKPLQEIPLRQPHQPDR